MGDGVNTITGTDTADTLTGTAGADVITAKGGNDVIYASAGADTVDGGAGSDRLIVDLFNQALFPTAPTGPEKYTIGAGSITDATGALNTHFTSVEQIRLTDTTSPSVTVDATGFTGSLNITTGSGNDVLIGNGQFGYLDAGLGSNTINGGGNSLSYSTAVISLDTSQAMATLGSSGSGAYSQVSASYTVNGVTATTTATNVTYVDFQSGVSVAHGLQIDGSTLATDHFLYTFIDSDFSDSLTGSKGSDTFYNSHEEGVDPQLTDGYDTFVGNGGSDDFDYVLDLPNNNSDHILDFDSDDTITIGNNGNATTLPDVTFVGTGDFTGAAREVRYEASDGKTVIYFDKDGDKVADGSITIEDGAFDLNYVVDGNGNGQLHLATPQGMYYGTDAKDTLAGSDAADVIRGYAGDDTVRLSAGQDFIDGGAGYDTVTGTIAGGSSYVVTDARIDGGLFNTAMLNVEAVTLTTSGAGAVTVDAHAATVAMTVTGGAGDDVILGGAGADALTGGLGNNRIDGGAGTDTAVFASTQAGSSVDFASDGSVVVTGSDGRDTLLNIEKLQFADGGAIDVAAAATVGALYVAWGGRDATAAELAYWTGQIASGATTLAGIKAAILADPLGTAHTDAVVTALYQDLGGRAPTTAELGVWEANVRAGASFDDVRQAILHDPLGAAAVSVTGLYEAYMGRAPTDAELGVWTPQVKGGLSLDAVRGAILDDASGHAHTDATVTQLYQTYGGRAPSAAELQTWEANVRAGASFDDVRHAILADPLGTAHTNDVVTGLYQTYGGRAPSAGELQVWHDNVLAGATYGDVRAAILADPLGTSHTDATIQQTYQAEFGRAASAGELSAWEGLVRSGATFDTLLDTLITDHGSDAAGTQRIAGTAGADAFAATHGHETDIAGFDPAHDTLTLSKADVASGNALDAAHARQVYALDGTPDVLFTLDDGHHVLLGHVTLGDLSSSNIHLA